jgi:hypothetical protein
MPGSCAESSMVKAYRELGHREGLMEGLTVVNAVGNPVGPWPGTYLELRLPSRRPPAEANQLATEVP